MTDFTNKPEVDRLREIARQGARKAAQDAHLADEASNFALDQLQRFNEDVSDDPAQRAAWLRTVARNYAYKRGAKYAREKPMGRQGSEPPVVGDEQIDQFVAGLILEMHEGIGPSLGTEVAFKVDFYNALALLSEATQALFIERYVESIPIEEMAESRGIKRASLDNQLTKARLAARTVFQDLYDDVYGGAQN